MEGAVLEIWVAYSYKGDGLNVVVVGHCCGDGLYAFEIGCEVSSVFFPSCRRRKCYNVRAQ